MSHQIYTTDAIVLSQFDKAETASVLMLFTRDFGLIYANAQGIRKIQSKLRNVLHNYAYIEVSLVYGREIWRVVNAREKKSFSSIKNENPKRVLFAQIISLLKRFLGQEEVNAELFNDVVSATLFLDGEALTKNELERFELMIILRILSSLGYVKEDLITKKESIPFSEILSFNEWSKEKTSAVEGKEKECILAINESFYESGL